MFDPKLEALKSLKTDKKPALAISISMLKKKAGEGEADDSETSTDEAPKKGFSQMLVTKEEKDMILKMREEEKSETPEEESDESAMEDKY